MINGSKLYGTLSSGSSSAQGAVFALNTDGTGYQTLHAFAGGPGDGAYPFTGLTLNGSKLFGTTASGGPDAGGVVFSLNLDGNGYNILHTFIGSTFVTTGPTADLVIQGTKIFGSRVGLSEPANIPSSDNGTLFSMNTDGTGYQVLHAFAAGSDGNGPVGALVLHNSHLLGVTKAGGSSDRGTVFTIDTDGSNFNLMHTFAASGDGRARAAGLTLVGDTLFGTSQAGGTNNWGTIFTIPVPEPSTLTLAALGIAGLVLCGWRRVKSCNGP